MMFLHEARLHWLVARIVANYRNISLLYIGDATFSQISSGNGVALCQFKILSYSYLGCDH